MHHFIIAIKERKKEDKRGERSYTEYKKNRRRRDSGLHDWNISVLGRTSSRDHREESQESQVFSTVKLL